MGWLLGMEFTGFIHRFFYSFLKNFIDNNCRKIDKKASIFIVIKFPKYHAEDFSSK
jgi:hypothetical protein